MKTEMDPVTQADTNSEIMITSTIEKYFPGVLVIGEEGVIPQPDKVQENINLDMLSSFENQIPGDIRQLNREDLCVWVDPLDGTISFLKQDWLGVTCLIGVTYLGRPIFGVIHHTFADQTPTYWGGPSIGMYTSLNPFESGGERFDAQEPENNRTLVTCLDHLEPHHPELIDYLDYKHVRHRGTGRRMIETIFGQWDCHLYFGSHMKKWDTCGPEAILGAVGGRITD